MPGSEPDYDHATPLEHITFDGNGSEDVTIFLQSVKRVALVQGRQRDDDWIVDYTEASLTGDGLATSTKGLYAPGGRYATPSSNDFRRLSFV
ncbi:hypothetical protein FRB95_007748 [Tulasnella sp. JGI-2019a]|nr:hypothetical protein FRB95_007748 [Tulasnella sp. JGI-2019a]